MPFNMFKAFSGSRSRPHRGDPAIYNDYPQGYPPGADFQPEPIVRSRPLLRRSSTKRREPIFTPLPSRAPTDAEDYNEGYIRVDSPDAVMGGALNARPVKIDPALPLGPGLDAISETLSEREHAARVHDIPRLLDRSPQPQRPPSFHGDHGVDPHEPIIMPHSPSRSSASEHTIEALRTPVSMHPNERVIPPLPHHYPGGYGPGSRSPTDIYGSHHYAHHDHSHLHHHPDAHLDRQGRTSYEKDSPIYYVIPGGMNVIFQDERGTEITRVGDFSGGSRPSRSGPFIIQDEHGRELYRYDSYGRGSHREPQIVRIDAYPSSNRYRHDKGYPPNGYRSDPSYGRGYDYYPGHGEYDDYREKDWRSRRDHRYPGYADYPSYGDYRHYRDHRDVDAYRYNGGYREHGGHGEHGDYGFQGRPEMYTPSRTSSRASHRIHGYADQMPLERLPHPAVYDDRLSERGHLSSRASVRHHEDEGDINGRLQALHI